MNQLKTRGPSPARFELKPFSFLNSVKTRFFPLAATLLALSAARAATPAKPTAIAFKAERPAPASAIAFDAQEKQNGSVEVPPVSLRSDGDWSVFLVTKSAQGNYQTGTVLSIGTPSDTLFTDAGHLSLTWCAQYPNAWKFGHFANSFVATAKDDAGTSASRRAPNGDQLFGENDTSPLVGQAGFDDARVHGLALVCRKGQVEFWSVDEAGARLMDYGATDFKGITNKPMRIGGALLLTQPQWPFTFWKQPVQGLVIWNGGALSPLQMSRLFAGADARDVAPLQAARDDRYYPGTISGGQLDELVSGKVGTLSGKVTAAASLLNASVNDDVLVDMDGFGQVLPRDPLPATSSRARFWGTRIGPKTDIRMRVVAWNAPEPLTAATPPVTDWTTVARGVGDGVWRGDVAGIPNGFADYDAEVSWKNAAGDWTNPKRLHRRFSMGVTVGIGGQSILQKMRDDGGGQRSFDPKVGGYLRAYTDMNQNTRGYQDNAQPQGWQTRWTPPAPQTSRDNWGENRLSEKLALLTQSPVGIGNFSVGGSPIREFLGQTDRWLRWKRFIQRERPQFAIWGNGQGDVGQSREARYAALDQLLAQYDEAVQSAPGGPWNYKFFVFPLNGDWGLGGNADGIRSYDVEWARSRAAQGKPVGVLAFALDETTQDGTHLSDDDSGLGILASRAAQTLAHAIGAVPFSGLGPEVNRANSRWKVADETTIVDLEIAPNGGTALQTASGGAPTGFALSIDGAPFVAPASASIVDATHIRLVAPIAAQKSVTVTYQSGAPGPGGDRNISKTQAGTDQAVYDNRGDAISGLPGFPLAPITGSDAFIVPKSAR